MGIKVRECAAEDDDVAVCTATELHTVTGQALRHVPAGKVVKITFGQQDHANLGRKPIDGRTAHARYCRPACRVADFHRRKREVAKAGVKSGHSSLP